VVGILTRQGILLELRVYMRLVASTQAVARMQPVESILVVDSMRLAVSMLAAAPKLLVASMQVGASSLQEVLRRRREAIQLSHLLEVVWPLREVPLLSLLVVCSLEVALLRLLAFPLERFVCCRRVRPMLAPGKLKEV
jgi:hypothetical protein